MQCHIFLSWYSDELMTLTSRSSFKTSKLFYHILITVTISVVYRLLHIHIYCIQTRLTYSSFILLMNISGRTSIFYKRILFLTINYVNALGNHFNTPNLTASQILVYIYIYILRVFMKLLEAVKKVA